MILLELPWLESITEYETVGAVDITFLWNRAWSSKRISVEVDCL